METLRLELFIDDLAASLDFYQRILGFRAGVRQPGGYTPLVAGAARVALNLRASLPGDHPIHRAPNERPGQGVEIVLEVDDVEAAHRHVAAQRWPCSELKLQPWGLTDFRVRDPDGYYWRVTSRGRP